MTKPFKVMGVLNGTPDSFSDGGLYVTPNEALKRVEQMCLEGADIIDIGCESSRPGAKTVSLNEELDRLLPILERVSKNIDVPISIDTYKPEVMKAALEYPIAMINDIFAFQLPGAIDAVKNKTVDLCVMHNKGMPDSLHRDKQYKDVINEVYLFLDERIQALKNANIQQERIIIDPGFGFAKTVEQNVTLLKNIEKFSNLNCQMLIGLSRKSMFHKLMGGTIQDRLPSCLSASLWCYRHGATWFRTHDVKQTRHALQMYTLLWKEVAL